MRTLIAHVYKEYRSHRAGLWVLLSLVALVAVVLAFASRLTPLEASRLLLLSTMAAVVVLLPPAVVAAESGRGHVFAFRLPGGAGVAFWSKLVFLAAALLLFTLAAHVAANLVALTADVADAQWLPLELALETSVSVWAVCSTVALSLVAVACWLPRAAFAVPAMALLLALLLVPSVLVAGFDLGLLRYITVPDAELRLLALLAFALLLAWVSFVRARRFGGGAARAAMHGGGLALLGSLALASWTALDLHRLDAIDAAQPITFSWPAFLDPSARYVYGHVNQGGPTLGVVVDLRSGSVERIGPMGARLFPCDLDSIAFTPSRPSRLMQARPQAFQGVDDITSMVEDVAFIDTASRDIAYRAPARLLADPSVFASDRTAARASTALRLPDGRRWWVCRGRPEIESGDGHERLRWDAHDVATRPIGYGLLFHSDRGMQIYDLVRQRRLPWPGSSPAKGNGGGCWVLRHAWLVGDSKRVGNHCYWHHWRLRDPDRENEAPAPGMRDGDDVRTMLDDGCVLVIGASGQSDDLWIVDTSTGERTHLDAPGLHTEERQRIALSDPNLAPRIASDGRRILSWYISGQGSGLTSYVPGAIALTPPIEEDGFVGSVEGARVLIVDDGELLRVDLDTGERTSVVAGEEAPCAR